MARLLFLLGSALAVAGLAAIGLGIEFLDGGWTQVIAGTVALSGGIVTTGLACVVVRLGAINRTLQGGEQGRTHAPPAEVHLPQEAAGQSAAGAAQQHAEAAEPATIGQTDLGEPDPHEFPVFVEGHAQEAVAGEPNGELVTAPISADDGRDGFVADAGDEFAHPAGSVPYEVVTTASHASGPAPDDRREGETSGDWLESALSGVEQGPEWSHEPQAEQHAPGAAPVAQGHVAGPEAEPGIVGRFSAGGVSYAMYEDGSIEADTANGVFRFESLAQLKAFIEQSGPSSSPAP